MWRHRWPCSAAAVLFVVTIVSIAGAIVVSGFNRQLETANADLSESNANLDVGEIKLRFAERRARALPFQAPPRITFVPPDDGPVGFFDGAFL